MGRRSFIIHLDSLAVLDDLTDEEAGKLFKAIKNHHEGAEVNEIGVVKVAFSPFKNQFERDNERYEKICEQRARSGAKGGQAKASKSKQVLAKASKSKQNLAKLADNDNVNDSDNDSDSKIIKSTGVDFSVFGMSDYQISELKRIRKANKGGTISQRVADSLAKEFHQAAYETGLSFDELLTEWELRGWKSFKAEWVKPDSKAKDNRDPFEISASHDWHLGEY